MNNYRTHDNEITYNSSNATGDFEYDVFVSYSHKNSDWVQNSLVPRLRKAGINCCIDEGFILLDVARFHFYKKHYDEAHKLSREALEISQRFNHIIQQADIHLFLAEYWRDNNDIPKAIENAKLAKLRSHQMIDIETGDYITNDPNTAWKYKPGFDKANTLLNELEAF